MLNREREPLLPVDQDTLDKLLNKLDRVTETLRKEADDAAQAEFTHKLPPAVAVGLTMVFCVSGLFIKFISEENDETASLALKIGLGVIDSLLLAAIVGVPKYCANRASVRVFQENYQVDRIEQVRFDEVNNMSDELDQSVYTDINTFFNHRRIELDEVATLNDVKTKLIALGKK